MEAVWYGRIPERSIFAPRNGAPRRECESLRKGFSAAPKRVVRSGKPGAGSRSHYRKAAADREWMQTLCCRGMGAQPRETGRRKPGEPERPVWAQGIQPTSASRTPSPEPEFQSSNLRRLPDSRLPPRSSILLGLHRNKNQFRKPPGKCTEPSPARGKPTPWRARSSGTVRNASYDPNKVPHLCPHVNGRPSSAGLPRRFHPDTSRRFLMHFLGVTAGLRGK